MHKIWQDGYHGASVKALSEMLGITRSSFYHTFKSREELFKEVLDVYLHFTPLARLAELEKGEPVLPAITQTIKILCTMRAADAQRRGCLAMNCVAELCGTDTPLSDLASTQITLSNCKIEQLLEWSKQQKEIPHEADTEALAISLTNLIIGLNIMSKAIHEERKLWLAAKTTLEGLGLFAQTNA